MSFAISLTTTTATSTAVIATSTPPMVSYLLILSYLFIDPLFFY